LSAPGRVIVVSYNSARELPACLVALQSSRGAEFEIVVVDNASTDGSVEQVEASGGTVRLIRNPANVGFGQANNRALDGDAPYFVLVNPDATVPPDAIATALSVLAARPEVGVVGLRHQDASGRDQPSAFPFLSLRGLLGEALGVGSALPAGLGLDTRRIPGFRPDRPSDVDWIQGSFMLVRGDVVRQVGGFDTGYFMYGEDLEWCWRIGRAGWKIAYLPLPIVTHIGGASGRGLESGLFVEHLRSRLRFFRQHRGPGALLSARTLTAIAILGRWAAREMFPRGRDGRDRRPLFRAAMKWVVGGQPLS